MSIHEVPKPILNIILLLTLSLLAFLDSAIAKRHLNIFK